MNYIFVPLLIFPIFISEVEEFACHLSPLGGAFEHHSSSGGWEFAQLKLQKEYLGELVHYTITTYMYGRIPVSGTLMVSCSYKITENIETEVLSQSSLTCFAECCTAFHEAYQLDSYAPFLPRPCMLS